MENRGGSEELQFGGGREVESTPVSPDFLTTHSNSPADRQTRLENHWPDGSTQESNQFEIPTTPPTNDEESTPVSFDPQTAAGMSIGDLEDSLNGAIAGNNGHD